MALFAVDDEAARQQCVRKLGPRAVCQQRGMAAIESKICEMLSQWHWTLRSSDLGGVGGGQIRLQGHVVEIEELGRRGAVRAAWG